MITILDEVLTEALFVSHLQPSAEPAAEAVRAAVTEAVIRHGADGCAALVAAEFGDHPETAVRRMAWARDRVAASYPAALASAAE
jgi:hypothetical protein